MIVADDTFLSIPVLRTEADAKGWLRAVRAKAHRLLTAPILAERCNVSPETAAKWFQNCALLPNRRVFNVIASIAGVPCPLIPAEGFEGRSPPLVAQRVRGIVAREADSLRGLLDAYLDGMSAIGKTDPSTARVDQVMRMRLIEGISAADCADLLGITRQRVGQILTAGLQGMRVADLDATPMDRIMDEGQRLMFRAVPLEESVAQFNGLLGGNLSIKAAEMVAVKGLGRRDAASVFAFFRKAERALKRSTLPRAVVRSGPGPVNPSLQPGEGHGAYAHDREARLRAA